MHVLVTKPAVKTLEHHHELAAAAANNNVLVCTPVARAPHGLRATVHGLSDSHRLSRLRCSRACGQVMIEVHKRFDPMYTDARDRIRGLGDFGYMSAYMSQPKMQLETFKAWAGKASDISYYLNSHHIDFHEVR